MCDIRFFFIYLEAFFNSLIMVYSFSVIVLICFPKFVFRYFNIFNTILVVIVFLSLFSGYSLVVYRNTVDFHILVLNLVTLLNLLVPIVFLVDYLGFFIYRIVSYAN